MCCEQKIWHHFMRWAHTLPWISEDGRRLKWNLTTDGSIRSSGRPGKTELRVCEILDSWPSISEVSNKEKTLRGWWWFEKWIANDHFSKKKTKQNKTNPTQPKQFCSSVHHLHLFILRLPPSSSSESSPSSCSSCNFRTPKGSSTESKHSALPESTTQDTITPAFLR